MNTEYLVAGCTPPIADQLDKFWQEAISTLGCDDLPADYYVRWIGSDAQSTEAILASVLSGQKTGSVSLPWETEHSGRNASQVRDAIVLINFDGTPSALLQITSIPTVRFADVTAQHTASDGPRVRAPEVWKPLHKPYFNMLLAPYGLQSNDDMPISFEKFELLYPESPHTPTKPVC